MSLKVIPHSAFHESTVAGPGKTVVSCSGGAHNGKKVILDSTDAIAGNEFIIGDWRDQHYYKVVQGSSGLILLAKYETPGYGGTNA